MTNLHKTMLLFLGLAISLPGIQAFGQTQYELKDSTNIRDRHKMRQWSYENNLTAFPPPKKNNWSLGVQGGMSFVSGDIRAQTGWAGAINLRRALGHTFSIRAQATMGNARGLNYTRNGGFINNPALNGAVDPAVDYTAPGTYSFVYYNFKTNFADFNVQGVVNLNNINFYKKDPKVSVYAFGGLGGFLYETKIDALDESGSIYDYSQIPTEAEAESNRDILNSLDNLLDGEYETMAETKSNRTTLLDRTLVPAVMVGGGISFKLSRRVDLAFEHRVTWTGDDLLDGQRWEETLTLTANSDYHQFSSVGINFRIGKGEESLWYSNPMGTAMDDIRTLKNYHSKADQDSDGDGVPDSRDKESGTPAGAAVDVMGRAIDSDQDGIQDFRDKEPFSPKGAQVDRSGVALDSDGDGVPDIFDEEINSPDNAQVDAKGRSIQVEASSGALSEEDADLLLPMVNFEYGKSEILEKFYPNLYYIARLMKQRPDMKMKVIGHADNRGKTDRIQKIAQERADAVVNFLNANFDIDKSRFETASKGAEEPLIDGLSKEKKAGNEGYYYLNRRVEFQIVK